MQLHDDSASIGKKLYWMTAPGAGPGASPGAGPGASACAGARADRCRCRQVQVLVHLQRPNASAGQ
eukprot:2693672-Karenia_brevis.AAC.1